jgi:hypothetical protein
MAENYVDIKVKIMVKNLQILKFDVEKNISNIILCYEIKNKKLKTKIQRKVLK